MDSIIQSLLIFLSTNPKLALVLTVMSVARMIFKPLCSLIQSYVDATPSTSDNAKWLAFQQTKGFKAVAYAVDLLLSFKIPVKKETADAPSESKAA